MSNIEPIRLTRNGTAITLAILAGIAMVAAPVTALFGVWQYDTRWLWTSVVVLVLAVVLYFLASQLFDAEPEVKK